MKFGVREICDVVFKAKSSGTMGKYTYSVGQPVLYIDTAKTSTIEGAATTVYATGGKGNSRLIAWEGERTLTFTVEDALLSPIGFAILSGAGLLNAKDSAPIRVHTTANAGMSVDAEGNVTINLNDALGADEKIDKESPVFVMVAEADGSLSGDVVTGLSTSEDGKSLTGKGTLISKETIKSCNVFVDFYIEKTAGVQELVIDASNFGGYYYVEGSTLFRRQIDGKDLPAEIVFPNVKVQSNFTFTMASSGDPSTFTFTMDAFPGYTMFDNKKKVLCAIQIIDDEVNADENKMTDSTPDEDETDAVSVN